MYNYNFSRHLSPIHTSQEQQSYSSSIIPNGNDDNPFTFSYNPYAALDLELSPRSSSPASEGEDSEDEDEEDMRSRSSSPEPEPAVEVKGKAKVVKEGNFEIEEIDEEDYPTCTGRYSPTSVLRPTQYSSPSPSSSPPRNNTSARDIDPTVLNSFKTLHCSPSPGHSDEEEDEREIWVRKMKEEKRRRRRSSVISKRSFAQSQGSDSDDADVQGNVPLGWEGVNEVGSSARRLRRKVGDRGSLIFEDVGVWRSIEEEEEPDSCEEMADDGGDWEGLSNLPYYVMDVDEWDE